MFREFIKVGSGTVICFNPIIGDEWQFAVVYRGSEDSEASVWCWFS